MFRARELELVLASDDQGPAAGVIFVGFFRLHLPERAFTLGSAMPETQKNKGNWVQGFFMEVFGLSAGLSLLATVLAAAVIACAIFWFFHSAPPQTLTLSAGPPGSGFYAMATNYQAILKEQGVNLRILASEGSLENLQRLLERPKTAEIGFVQSGLTNGSKSGRIVSLGSLSIQPMLVFYRADTPLQLLSQLKGKRLVIGPVGSGARSLALELLALNRITNSGTAAVGDLDGAAAASALAKGEVDAIFLMGDSASTEVIRSLLRRKDIHLYDFVQADGYVRRINYLSKLEMPRGAIDFGNDIPDHDTALVGPAVELLARADLHPALSDLLLETAKKVNGKAGLLRRQDEFPAPIERDFPLSEDAERFYKSGKKFFYRYMPFWVASLVNRVVVVFVPAALVLIPLFKMLPSFFRWRTKVLILKWYRRLLTLEKELQGPDARSQPEKFLARLDEIENAVNKMKVPAFFADQFYNLRGHITFVRGNNPQK
jgi:hypothetical protein